MDVLMEPWPWYIAGPLVGLIMLALLSLGRSFGFSSNFRTMCAAVGAGKRVAFFRFDWRSQSWNLLFLVGAVAGGFLAAHFLDNSEAPRISTATLNKLASLGIETPVVSYYPEEIFDSLTVQNVLIWAFGGLLIGFGSRYAGGCTSGHAISGLSNLEIPSLIAVVGFFIGGLLMVHLVFPIIF